jgi:glycyl-tRNA synthetase alpha chain
MPAELTYELERITAFLQVKDSIYDINWSADTTYAQVRFNDELQFSVYNFEMADVGTLWKLFDLHEGEAARLLVISRNRKKARFHVAGLRARAEMLAFI